MKSRINRRIREATDRQKSEFMEQCFNDEPRFLVSDVFEDKRGYWEEIFNVASLPILCDINHIAISFSKKWVLRGLHYQKGLGKIIKVIAGEIYDVVVDVRAHSPRYKMWRANVLTSFSPELWIPPGYAHGFLVQSSIASVLYGLTAEYNHAQEITIKYNDPDLHINWGNVKNIIQSPNDANGIAFKDFPIRDI